MPGIWKRMLIRIVRYSGGGGRTQEIVFGLRCGSFLNWSYVGCGRHRLGNHIKEDSQ